jgi:uncharacterized protein YndB with AHSA1/START domain
MKGDPGGSTFHLEKLLRAPRERVFAACVEPEKLAEWWGPKGFTVAGVEMRVRVGGRYRLTMQPPDGEAFHLMGQFYAVEPPRRLVYTFECEEPDPDDQETVVTLSFQDCGPPDEADSRPRSVRDRGATRPARDGLDGDPGAVGRVSGLRQP